MKKYVFKKYNDNYPKLFLKEKERLKRILPSSSKIEHIGSTAVPGLGGKGIIDIMVGFKSKKEMKKYVELMEQNKYEIMPGFKPFGRISFKKICGFLFWKRRVHVHFAIFDGKLWKRNIKFRDNLMKKTLLVKKYEQIKKDAVKYARGEGKKYREYKEKFIKELTK